MRIKCDICDSVFSYPYNISQHKHPEYELGGVPANVWTLICEGEINETKKGSNLFRYFNCDFISSQISLGEGNTSLIEVEQNLYIKDESTNPTGSFKDRGMPFLMNEALYSGKKKIAICSTGNAAISLIQYAKAYGVKPIVFVPKDLPKKKREMLDADEIHYSENIITCFEDFFAFCEENEDVFNGFLSTDPAYIMGLASLSYEIYDQLNETVPDYIFLPCASGGNIVAQFSGWKRMLDKGEIKRMPRFVFVQIEGGNPVQQGFEHKQRDKLYVIEEPADSKTILSSDTCFNYFKIYEMLEDKHAIACSIQDSDIDKLDMELKMKYDYTSLSVIAAFEKMKNELKENEKAVLIMTAKNRGEENE